MFNIFKKPKEYWGKDRKAEGPDMPSESEVHSGSKLNIGKRSVVGELNNWTSPDTTVGDDLNEEHLHSGDAPPIEHVGQKSITIGHETRHDGIRRPIRSQIGAGRFGQQPISTPPTPMEEIPAEGADPESILMRAEEEGHNVFYDDIGDGIAADEQTEDDEEYSSKEESTPEYRKSSSQRNEKANGNKPREIVVEEKVREKGEKKGGRYRNSVHGAQKPKRKTEHESRRI